MRILQFLLASFILLVSGFCWAAKKSLPLGCRAVGYEFKHGTLVLRPVAEETPLQTVYLIHNQSHKYLQMKSQVDPRQVAKHDFKHVIKPDSWVGFSVDQSHLELTCKTVSRPAEAEMGHMDAEPEPPTDTMTLDSHPGFGSGLHIADSGFSVNCGETIEICQYPRAVFAEHNRGTYWIGEGSSRKRAVKDVIEHGILLRS